ncbi:trypsin-like serine peptidase [Actinokineospora enzanensis]|uniref:trypsin-like serine peptidase n=1 Tax=Actinokineospora enzanensis TaxID=155975 RepID=UPI00037786E3|nr:hypothetical protein [Actinokineospora enzanensis]
MHKGVKALAIGVVLAAGATAAAAMSSPATAADQAVVYRDDEDAAAVRAYWTPERMRQAIDLDRPGTAALPGGPRLAGGPDRGPGTTGGPDWEPRTAGGPGGSPAAIGNAVNARPAGGPDWAPGAAEPVAYAGSNAGRAVAAADRRVGRMFAVYANQPFTCTAAGVPAAAGKGGLIVTAAHCVKQPNGFATRVLYLPGFENGSGQSGTFVGSTYTIDSGFTPVFPGSPVGAFDMAFVSVGPNESGKRLSEVGGEFQVAFDHAKTGLGTAVHYSGDTQTSCLGIITPSSIPTNWVTTCPGASGSSGGALVQENIDGIPTIVGVIGGADAVRMEGHFFEARSRGLYLYARTL